MYSRYYRARDDMLIIVCEEKKLTRLKNVFMLPTRRRDCLLTTITKNYFSHFVFNLSRTMTTFEG